MQDPGKDNTLACNSESCATLPQRWKAMAARGSDWCEMQKMECHICSTERDRRNRLLEEADPRVRQELFLSAFLYTKTTNPSTTPCSCVQLRRRNQNASIFCGSQQRTLQRTQPRYLRHPKGLRAASNAFYNFTTSKLQECQDSILCTKNASPRG